MRTVGQGNPDDVIGRDDSIGKNDGHDARFANEIACQVVIENGGSPNSEPQRILAHDPRGYCPRA